MTSGRVGNGARALDWNACEIAAQAAAGLPGVEWREWRDQVRMVVG